MDPQPSGRHDPAGSPGGGNGTGQAAQGRSKSQRGQDCFRQGPGIRPCTRLTAPPGRVDTNLLQGRTGRSLVGLKRPSSSLFRAGSAHGRLQMWQEEFSVRAGGNQAGRWFRPDTIMLSSTAGHRTLGIERAGPPARARADSSGAGHPRLVSREQPGQEHEPLARGDSGICTQCSPETWVNPSGRNAADANSSASPPPSSSARAASWRAAWNIASVPRSGGWLIAPSGPGRAPRPPEASRRAPSLQGAGERRH